MNTASEYGTPEVLGWTGGLFVALAERNRKEKMQ